MKSLLFLFALVGCVFCCPYVIQVGDTLDQIATDQNCDLTAILNANPGLNPSLLQVGQTIELPSSCSSCGSIPPPLPTTPGCDNSVLPLTEDQLKSIFVDFETKFTGQAAPFCDVHEPAAMIAPLNDALSKFQITTPLRVAAFLGQIGHESADLRCWEENPEFTGRCVDVNANDYSGGCKFRGRGPIQLTNDFNYQAANIFLTDNIAGYNSDIFTNPDLVKTDILIGFETTGWFWTQNALVNGQFTSLNVPSEDAANDCYAFANITIGVQGGCQVPSQRSRVERYCRARQILGVDPVGTECGYDNFPCPGDPCKPLPVGLCVAPLAGSSTIVLSSVLSLFALLFVLA